MDDIKKIGYRPDLQYTDEYNSDIKFKQDNNEHIDEEDNNSLVNDLLEQGDALQNMINKLPSFISEIISDPVDPIISFVKDELSDKTLEKVPVELDWSYNTDD